MSNQWLPCPNCEDITFKFEVDVEKESPATSTSPKEPVSFIASPASTICSYCAHELTTKEQNHMEETAIEMYKSDWIEQREAHKYDYEED